MEEVSHCCLFVFVRLRSSASIWAKKRMISSWVYASKFSIPRILFVLAARRGQLWMVCHLLLFFLLFPLSLFCFGKQQPHFIYDEELNYHCGTHFICLQQPSYQGSSNRTLATLSWNSKVTKHLPIDPSNQSKISRQVQVIFVYLFYSFYLFMFLSYQ